MLLYLVKTFKLDLFNKLYTRDKDENGVLQLLDLTVGQHT